MKATIQIADYVVLGATVLLSLITGLYYAIKERNKTSVKRYHLGDGKLKALPVALSLLVTFESSIFFLGYPAEVYVHGFLFWLANIGLFIGFSNLLWTSVPLFFPLKITSVYEYLEERYGESDIRRFATFLSSLSMVLYAGIVLYGAGTALESVTHIPTWAFIVGMSVIAVIYTALGGLKAVVATDVIQGIIMLTAIIAIIAIVIKGTMDVGGVSEVLEINRSSGRLKLIDFNPDPMIRHTFWTLVVGGGIRALAISFKQPSVQRLNSTASQSEARKVVYMALPAFVILQIFVMYEGLVAYAYFSNKGCDPLAAGDIKNPNQVISYTVLDMFKTTSGLPGLFLGALGSASLSTISSLLSSVSAVVSEDLVKPNWKGVTDAQLTKISKVIVILTGAVCAGIAIMMGSVKGPLPQIASSFIGSVDAPLTALFFMAVYCKFATKRGVMIGAFVGLIFGGWISGGYNFSSGRKRTPWLPLGPTDKCPNMNTTSFSCNLTSLLETTPIMDFGSFNASLGTQIYSDLDATTAASENEQIITGINNLYSISYKYFPAMIMILTFIVGLTVSKFTKSDRPVPDHLVLSFRRQFLCCFGTSKRKEKKDVLLDNVHV